MKQNYLITGCCGFIGFSIAQKLLKLKKNQIYGIDNLNSYYSKDLKLKRLSILKKKKNFKFLRIDLRRKKNLTNKIQFLKFKYVYHFAAQPGVRYSLINPKIYYDTNVKGFSNLISNLNFKELKRVIYASSSSVYGDQTKFPTKENAVLKAKNPYGKTKISNENQAKKYEKIYKIPFIGVRLFTVYGEWGRPDMFIIKLLNTIKKNKTFYLNNSGNHKRDFTYINDVIKILIRLKSIKLNKDRIFNICGSNTVSIKIILKEIKKYFPNIKIKNIKKNRADVKDTFGDNKLINSLLRYKKYTRYQLGIKKTVFWYKKYLL